MTAARYMWEWVHGEITEPGLYVCHHCDNPRCVRPDHLFLGTPRDNAIDMIRKGRQSSVRPKGEKHGLHKLTEIEVIQIRNALRAGARPIDLARRHGVTKGNIGHISAGTTWRHLA